MSRAQDSGSDPPWWHGAVIYQLYVRSWRDSNDDGYGDLRGIIERLDHLSWLGVDAIWLSPTMPSPDEDWGYDVSDYTGVHPELGTLADLDELIAEAGRRGLRVLLDLVPNHTSSAHPWFVEAAASRDAAHRDYYVWADPRPDGGPPNNWLDFTGRPAWQWHDSGQYYLHNFLPGQPDLNWWEPAVHREFRDILEFWFERGVAGFRIDVANGLYKDAELRDNPPAAERQPAGGRVRPAARSTTSTGRRRTASTATGARSPRATRPRGCCSARRGSPTPSGWPPTTATTTSCSSASTSGSPSPVSTRPGWPRSWRRRWPRCRPARARCGWAPTTTWAGSPSRWCGGDERKIRLALLVLATLPGTAVLYYGDEIGMTDVDVPAALRRDNATLDVERGADRDRARTPHAVGRLTGRRLHRAGRDAVAPDGGSSGRHGRRPAR